MPDGWPTLAGAAAQSLTDELEAVSKRRTQTDVTIRGGHVVAIGQSRVVMRFEADSDVPGRDGMSATLVVEAASFDVEIISLFGSVVTVSLGQDAPRPSTAKLRCDLSWLLTAQSRRLRELAGGAPGFNPAAAMAAVSVETVERQSLQAITRRGLNPVQSLAVEHGLCDGVTWLWGPPGTGKTSALSVLVQELYDRGDRIFLTGPTNTAVDIALQGALGRIDSFETGSVVRVGQPVDQTLVGRPAGRVLVDEVAEERGEPIATRKMQVAEQIRRLRAAISRPGPGHEDRSADELELAELSAMSRALDLLMKEMRRQVCRDAQLVAATAHQSVLSTLSGLPYDVVVVDEASMMSAALCMLASGAGSGHTVIAGDFRQLPPVVISDTSSATRWLRRSAFEAAGISARVTRNDPPSNLIALTEQYRMPEPPLADALSDGFYPENRLITSESVRQRANVVTVRPPAPIVFVDTTALRTRVARRGGSTSRYNLLHVLVAACLLDDVATVGNRPALITPFAPQARLLESLVGDGADGGIASTVHRFQGGETDVVIFDAVDADLGDLPVHPWFETGEEGTDGARLVNVAMSRARQRLVILADLKRIHRRRLGRDAMSRFFRTAARDADLPQSLERSGHCCDVRTGYQADDCGH